MEGCAVHQRCIEDRIRMPHDAFRVWATVWHHITSHVWQGFGHDILVAVLFYECVQPEAKLLVNCNHRSCKLFEVMTYTTQIMLLAKGSLSQLSMCFLTHLCLICKQLIKYFTMVFGYGLGPWSLSYIIFSFLPQLPQCEVCVPIRPPE